nr:MAG TPA: hypothetical protein [Caudoviricetes sp.]
MPLYIIKRCFFLNSIRQLKFCINIIIIIIKFAVHTYRNLYIINFIFI